MTHRPEPLSFRAATAQDFPAVSVAEGTNEDAAGQILQTALQGIGGLARFVMPGQTVAIKPNATWAYPPHTASSTDPEFLTAVIQAVRDAGAGRIIVMDHCSIEPGAEESVRVSGIGKVVKDMGVESIFPDRFNAPSSTYTKIALPNGRANQSIGVIKAAVEADVRINLAMAKSHNVTKLTMCLKHMMGFLQKPSSLHASLEQGIADLSTPSAVQAQLHLLEAIRVRKPHGSYQVCAGPETEITHPEIISRQNVIVAGVDPVLIDAYGCLYLFERQPQELTHLLRAHESGCGDMDVEAALADGRIRRFKVGAAMVDSTAVAEKPVGAETQSAAPQPAGADAPGTASAGQAIPPAAIGATSCSPADQVITLGPLLNLALIPVAAVVSGFGLLILNRMRRQLPKDHLTTGGQPTGQSDSMDDEGRD